MANKASSVVRLAAALSKAREAYPRQRLAQIVSNAVSVANGPGGDDDIFYLEDDDLIRAIKRYIEQAKP